MSMLVTELTQDRVGPSPEKNTAARDLLIAALPSISRMGYSEVVACLMYPQLSPAVLEPYVLPMRTACEKRGLGLTLGFKTADEVYNYRKDRYTPKSISWWASLEYILHQRSVNLSFLGTTGRVYHDWEDMVPGQQEDASAEWRSSDFDHVREVVHRAYAEMGRVSVTGLAFGLWMDPSSKSNHLFRALLSNPSFNTAQGLEILAAYPFYKNTTAWGYVLDSHRALGYRALPGLFGGSFTNLDRNAWLMAHGHTEHWLFVGNPKDIIAYAGAA